MPFPVLIFGFVNTGSQYNLLKVAPKRKREVTGGLPSEGLDYRMLASSSFPFGSQLQDKPFKLPHATAEMGQIKIPNTVSWNKNLLP